MSELSRKTDNAILDVLEALAEEVHHYPAATPYDLDRRKHTKQALERLRNLVVKGEE